MNKEVISSDKNYSTFCYKMLFFYNYIKENIGKVPTLREMDTYLINIANERLNSERKV